MPDRLISRYPNAAALVSHAWPVGLGAVTGEAVAQSASWNYPLLAAMLSGAVLQLLIALLRSLFHERRDVMTALREMLKEKERGERATQAVQRRIRHDLANRAHVAEVRLALIRAGVPVGDLPEVQPLYDTEAEAKAEESDEIHESRV